MREQSSGAQADRICAQIAALTGFDLKDLKSRWRDWYETEPPPRIGSLARACSHITTSATGNCMR